ncbi:dna-directed rna polymerases i ii and iii subunit rpabc2 [Holotrichia oblita]|uniref:Dna-directed rna polymerases i ii and iii subunit rpabc2 n=1 Tax=Holotrichia oblita TaxID=644536 RepID=A0ACB9TRP6_HOLOL|nr:dna-directed rna polymerases i ii and iii subunit rpabc2 [Holotrichia oblita]
MTEQRVHKLRSNAFYDLLRENYPKTAIFSFDCEKNLPLPKIPDQACYFSMQINLYNFTVVSGHSKSKLTPENVKSFTWTEKDRQRGSNEIVSAVFYALQNFNFDEEVQQVRLVCDGCGGQNKNSSIIGMVQYWLKRCSPPQIQLVELVYPVVGHSFLPPDRVFGQIERKIKKYANIIKEYATVLRMGEDYPIFDWKSELMKVLKSPGSWHFCFKPSKRIIFTKATDGSVLVRGEPFYKNDISTAKSICKKFQTVNHFNLHPLNTGRSLKPDKIRSISSLLAKHYGAEWENDERLEFFKNAFQANPGNTSETQPDVDDTLVFSDNNDLRI